MLWHGLLFNAHDNRKQLPDVRAEATYVIGGERMSVIECDQKDCEFNEDGECGASMVAIIGQECLTYRCRDIDYDEEEE